MFKLRSKINASGLNSPEHGFYPSLTCWDFKEKKESIEGIIKIGISIFP